MKKIRLRILQFILFSSAIHCSLPAEWIYMQDDSFSNTNGNVTYLQDQWVSWGLGSIYTSDGAVEWKKIDVPHHWLMGNVLFGNGKWMIPDYAQSSQASFSDHLEKWEIVEFQNVDEKIVPKSFANNFFWASSPQPIRWYQSTDGVNWNRVPDPFHRTGVVTTQEGRVITEEDLALSIESEIFHAGHITILRNTLLRGDSLGNLAYTVDGVNWGIVRLELKDGSVWTSETLDAISLNTVLQYAQGAEAYRGALYRPGDESVIRIDGEGNEIKIDVFEQAGVEPLRYDIIESIFQSSTRLYAGTSTGKIFQSYNGMNWEIRLNQPKMLTEKFIQHDDNILIVSRFGNRYLLKNGDETPELVSAPTTFGMVDIVETETAWFGAMTSGVVRSEDGIKWEWSLDVETDSGEFSGNNVILHSLMRTGDTWVAYGSSSTGSSWDDEDNTTQRIVWISEDGVHWEVSPVMLDGEPMKNWTSEFVYGNGKWVATEINEHERMLLTSEDGIHFQRSGVLDSEFGGGNLAYFNDCFVYAKNQKFLYSKDGVDWTAANFSGSIPSEHALHTIRYYQTSHRLLAFNGWTLWETTDGKTWQSLPNPVENPGGYSSFDDGFLEYDGSLFYTASWRVFSLQNKETWVADTRLPGTTKKLLHHPKTGDMWLYTGNGMMADESVLDLPRVTIEQVNGYEFFEGQSDVAAFSVKRTGDIRLPLDVHLQIFGDAICGVDYAHNVQRSDDHYLLHFDPGFSELYIRITIFSDTENDNSEFVGFEILPTANYDCMDLQRAYSSIVITDPE